jgi:hypothetical protein
VSVPATSINDFGQPFIVLNFGTASFEIDREQADWGKSVNNSWCSFEVSAGILSQAPALARAPTPARSDSQTLGKSELACPSSFIEATG